MTFSGVAFRSEDLGMYESPSHDYIAVVSAVVSSLKEDVAYENHQKGHTWKFTYGTVEVFVHLSGISSSDTLTVWSPVLNYPVKDELQLLKTLLERNWSDTLEARFTLWNDQVVLNYIRTLEEISPTEISRAITVVATLADEYDEPLATQYSAP